MIPLSIDSKLKKFLERKPELVPEHERISQCIIEAQYCLNNHQDCLLIASPASFKTHLLLSIACSSLEHQEKKFLLPSKHRPYYARLFSEQSMENIHIQTFAESLNDMDTNKRYGLILIDEGELLGDFFEGERLESLLVNIPPTVSVVLGMNECSNAETIATWLTDIRHRPCQIIQAHFPKKIIHTFLSHKGDWLPLLDKKKLNNKVKVHIKSNSNKHVQLKKYLFQTFHLLSTQKLFPTLFVMPSESQSLLLWRSCMQSESSPGKYLTIPNIVHLLETYPRLKDNPLLFEMLQKRAAFCYFKDKPWLSLVESLFILNAFDCVFATSEVVSQLYCRFKSIVFFGHPENDEKTLENALTLKSDQLLMRLGVLDDDIQSDSHKQDFFCIVGDVPDVEPVIMKDFLVSGQNTLKSQFKWTLQNVLSRIIQKRPAMRELEKSFVIACHGSANDAQFHDTVMEIQAELPHARCIPVIAMDVLNNAWIKWRSKLSEILSHLKHNRHPGLYLQQEKYQFLLDCLPCNDCAHQTACQQRGSRTFRELVDTFHRYRMQKEYIYLFLQMEHSFFQKFLIQSGLIDSNKEVTQKGQLSEKLGHLINPLLVECLSNQTIFLDNKHLGASVLAGFLSQAETSKWRTTLKEKSIESLYHQLRPHLQQSANQLLSLGLIPQLPDFQYSCLYYKLTSGEDWHLLFEQTGLKQSDAEVFIEAVDLVFFEITQFFRGSVL
ncbi:MAG: hypothetical protein HQK75_02505 [Candidatus Magnetomorum sp.]|nr:hypothetical protein [Candidatus Magnetomorum sp.]